MDGFERKPSTTAPEWPDGEDDIAGSMSGEPIGWIANPETEIYEPDA